MQISLFYQRQHHLQRGASEKQLQILESYGIIVYSEYNMLLFKELIRSHELFFDLLILERVATIYTMHYASGLYIVDKMTEFFIPNSKDQLQCAQRSD